MNDPSSNHSEPSQPSPADHPVSHPRPPIRTFSFMANFKWLILGLLGFMVVSSLMTLASVSTWYRAAAIEHFEAGDYEKAEAAAEAAIDWSEEDPALRVWYAELLCQIDKPEKAIIQIEKGHELAPENMHLLLLKSSMLLRLKKYDAAFADIKIVVEQSSKQSDLQYHQALNGRAYLIAQALSDGYEKADVQQGLDDVEQALSIFGNEPSYIDTRGYLKMFADDLEGASQDINSAVAEYEELLTALEESLKEQTLNSTASQMNIKKVKETLSVLYHHRGELLTKQEKLEEAKKDFEKSEEFGFSRKKGIW